MLFRDRRNAAIEVLAANGVETHQQDGGVISTLVISRAILVYNRGRNKNLADGIVSLFHNPPEDGGFKWPPMAAQDTSATR